MIRCRGMVRQLQLHRTSDAISPSAAQALKVAEFAAGHTAQCDCLASEGTIEEKDCAGLTVSDAGGNRVARFEGRGFRAMTDDEGRIVIYNTPNLATQDSADPYQTPLEAWGPREAKQALKLANEKNKNFWEPKEGTFLRSYLEEK
jgi:hypothetical protein